MLRRFRIQTTFAAVFAVFFSAVMPIGSCYCAGCSCENNVLKNSNTPNAQTKSCYSGRSLCCKEKISSPQSSDTSSCCQTTSKENSCNCGSSGDGCQCNKITASTISLPDAVSPVKRILNHNDDFCGILVFASLNNAVYDHSAALRFLRSSPEAAHVPLHVLLCVFVI
ncbi:MAG: hypothetical protein LBT05_07655 [Planctomycetaceae bacterium]|jgi:hypothetical protein|nr:hypothetical protein [Planctomycetaceae bacterium]